jgi:hypothetical protein
VLDCNMRVSLIPHPDFHCEAVTGIDVETTRVMPAALMLRYVVRGDIGKVRLPTAMSFERSDGLWQHTCFEAFLKPGAGETYNEFNFAPSTRWAAYQFSGYREGMITATSLATPAIILKCEDGLLEIDVNLNVQPLPELAQARIWRAGLSAVIEETGGLKSYWALAHPPGRPDFHHPDCFALELPPALRP